MLAFKEPALALTAIAAMALGIAVYQRTPDRVWNRLFAVHAVGGGIWTFLNYLLEVATDPMEAGMWLRLTHPVVAMVICTAVDFAWVFPDRIDYVEARKRIALYATGAVFGTVAFAPNLYRSLTLDGNVVNIEYGWPFAAFGIFTVVALGYADVVLLGKAIRLEGVQRVQVIWVLIGLAGSHLVASLAIIIIPLVWRTTAYSGWGAGGYIITLAGMSYAIAKHRLMQPETALRRLASATVSAGVVLSVGIAGMEALQPALVAWGVPLNLAYIVVGLVMGLCIVVLHDHVAALLRHTLSSQRGPQAVHADAASHLLRTLDSEQLLRYLVTALDSALDPTSVVVYTGEGQNGRLAPRAAVQRQKSAGRERTRLEPLDRANRIVEFVTEERGVVTRDQVFRFGSLDDARRLAIAMSSLDVQVVAPMMWEDELIGLVTLGPKLSGDMYSDEDLRFVADIALQASLSLRNAELYAQTASLKDFNERILRQMDNAVVVTDAQERVVVFNEAAERLFGLPAQRALGQTIDVLPEGIANCIRASLGSGRILPSQHLEIERADRRVPLACSTSPLAGDGDGSQGAVAVISDLTLIQELERERQEAERLALVRMISAGMAHEIRNPLVAIRTFAELAPRRLDDPDFRSNFLTVAQQEIRRIDKLVGDLLTLSKPADAVVERVRINGICRQAARATAGLAEAKRVRMELATTRLRHSPLGDSSRLYQALLNLVSNAIDAEPPGGRVRLTTESAHNPRCGEVVRIRVHNAGSYIRPEDQDEIFRPFVSRKAQGTGL
ncbi:MAG: histidine kinase dimerization/phospho-acceptor domain-containing protein, partial [Armatimonadota bacterium]